MSNYNLEKRDIYQMASLVKISTNIYNLYLKLCKLETSEKKDSEEYRKYLDYLSIYIDVENKIYEESELTLERILSWAKFLFNFKIEGKFNLEDVMTKKELDINTLVIYRILNVLLTKLTKCNNDLFTLSDKEISNITLMLGITNENKYNKHSNILLNKFIEKDFFYLLLSYLQEYIDDKKYKLFRQMLTMSKYNAIFLNKDIENFEIINNFDIPNSLYIYSRINSDLLKINFETYTQIISLFARNIADNEIYELLEIEDIDYNNISKSSTSILRQCMIKSAFMLMSSKTADEVNLVFREYIDNEEYIELDMKNSISTNLIINCFNDIELNKSRIKILSLGNN